MQTFKAWEGVEAQHKGVELNTFSLGDYGIPYGYTPLLITLPSTLQCAIQPCTCLSYWFYGFLSVCRLHGGRDVELHASLAWMRCHDRTCRDDSREAACICR